MVLLATLGNTFRIKIGIRSDLDNKFMISEFNRYGKLLAHDITKLTDNELIDFSDAVERFYAHTTFESAFRVSLQKREEVVALAHE